MNNKKEREGEKKNQQLLDLAISREGAAAVPSAAEAAVALLRNRNAELLEARPLTCSVEQFKYPLALSCLGWFFSFCGVYIYIYNI